MIGQARNEAILRAHLMKYGVQVELGSELVEFEQSATSVTAHVLKRNGASDITEIISTPYLVGADSARSEY